MEIKSAIQQKIAYLQAFQPCCRFDIVLFKPACVEACLKWVLQVDFRKKQKTAETMEVANENSLLCDLSIFLFVWGGERGKGLDGALRKAFGALLEL